MGWVVGEVDGVVIKQRSIIGTAEWGAAKDTMIELMAAQLSDRLDMGESIADSFADGGDVSGGVCSSGYVKNDETAEVLAQAGSNIMPVMASASQDGYIISDSGSHSAPYASWHVFDNNTGTWYNTTEPSSSPWWIQVQLPAAKIVVGYSITGMLNAASPNTWQFQGSNNGSNWTTLDSRSGISGWSDYEKRNYSFTNSTSYLFYRIYITANNGTVWVGIREMEIIEADTLYQPAYPNPTTITVVPYTPDTALEKVRITLMVEDVNNSGAIALGDAATDLLQAYLSYDGNSNFGSALTFSEEPYSLTEGSNIYVFNSDDVDVSGESISSLGMKLQSFDRGAGAPEFRFHAYIIAGKELVNE